MQNSLPVFIEFAAEIVLKMLIVVGVSALLFYIGTYALQRQAEADYMECLSWKNDGHAVQCSEDFR
ncbi:hypothetical protein [Moraxella canis]|uniref:hypothetical protein n=1 Tax=Moraxella canis TaxID=90239 RepID=UPI00066561A0|nr:hypothetical protein [Moraxella canis]